MHWTHTLKPIWPTSYAPSPPIPRWFQGGLTTTGGLNPRGEPNFIVGWAMDMWEFCNGNPRTPKYLNPNNPQVGWACFVLEQWVPAEFYDRTEWDNLRMDIDDEGKFVDRLGEYKNRGTYILVKPLMTDDYVPLELSQQLLEVLQWGMTQGPLTGEALQKHNAIQRKLKQAREAEVIDKQTAERREWFKSNSERINRLATRHTVSGLVVPDSQTLKNMSQILLPASAGLTGKEQHVD